MTSAPVFLTPDQWLTDHAFTILDLNDLFIRWSKANSHPDSPHHPLVLTLGRVEEEQMMGWTWSISYTRTAFDGMTPKQADEKVRRDSSYHWQSEWKAGRRYLPFHTMRGCRIDLLDVESHCELS